MPIRTITDPEAPCTVLFKIGQGQPFAYQREDFANMALAWAQLDEWTVTGLWLGEAADDEYPLKTWVTDMWIGPTEYVEDQLQAWEGGEITHAKPNPPPSDPK